MKILVLLLLSSLVFAGCKKVEIKNGKVPDKYLHQARKLEGVYHGSFEGHAGKIKIIIEGNTPVLLAQDLKGDNLLLPRCRTSIDHLKWVQVGNKKNVKSAAFYFDPGACDVKGREVILSFDDNYNRINLRVLDHSDYSKQCRWQIHYPNLPYRDCTLVQNDIYLNGWFSR
ncbi:MAG: hypothetical protein ACXVCP_06650 [Bdellovibrio sp.]